MFANFGAGTFLKVAYPVIASAFVKWLMPPLTNMNANKIRPIKSTVFIFFVSFVVGSFLNEN
jgi:hypothetical protein